MQRRRGRKQARARCDAASVPAWRDPAGSAVNRATSSGASTRGKEPRLTDRSLVRQPEPQPDIEPHEQNQRHSGRRTRLSERGPLRPIHRRPIHIARVTPGHDSIVAQTPHGSRVSLVAPPRVAPTAPAEALQLQWSWSGSPGSVARTVRHESQVILRITSVIARPMIGSPICAPSETTIALATTPSETNPSTRAWLPSAIRAGLDEPPASPEANLRGDLVADEADQLLRRPGSRDG